MNRGPGKKTGRGAADNPAGRFESILREPDEDVDPEGPSPRTLFFRDRSASILSRNNSPDLGFNASLNPYRGCEHGCAYCYARPTHEYLGFSSGLDFESRILVKEDAPALLEKALRAKSWTPGVIAFSGVTDPYQPAERRFKLTRGCLEVAVRFRQPVAIITKNFLVTRDIDCLAELARYNAAAVCLSVTSLDEELIRTLEPRTSRPMQRLEAIKKLSAAGVPTGVFASPMIPGLTDHELPAILNAAAEHGASFASYQPVRLPGNTAEVFDQWLLRHAPGRRKRVLSRLRDMRGGELDDRVFERRFHGEGPAADALASLFRLSCRRAGLASGFPALSSRAFRRPGDTRQLSLLE